MKFVTAKNISPVKERFTLDDITKKILKEMTPNFGFNGVGEMVFMRTYSRDGENWADVVIRVIEGIFSIRKDHYTRNSLEWSDTKYQKFAREMAIGMFKMTWLPPGRGLWLCGTDFVYNKGSMGLNNCGAVDTEPDLVFAAEWAMDGLMNGVGIGFNTLWKGTVTVPDKSVSEQYMIEDSREGWVDSIIALMTCYISSPKYGKNDRFPVFDYSLIRPAGSKIAGFGGVASGPDPLRKLHKQIEGYLDAFSTGTLNCMCTTWEEGKDGGPWVKVEKNVSKPYSNHSRLITDIFNSIGACVVAGNVRRSAEIALGDVEDNVFINLKNYTENPERSEIGWMSNNSVILKDRSLMGKPDFRDFDYIPELANRIRDNGEPGMINLYNIQKYGRYGKPQPDKANLVNPCGEIPLCSTELCNLSEVFPPRCDDATEFIKAVKQATFYSSTVSLLPTHRPETNAIIAQNRRIGVSLSGIAQWASMSSESHPGWGSMNYTRMTFLLRKAYNEVKTENIRLAQESGIPASVRVTTVKPSGSISLLAGCTPGVHYPFSRYAIRRVRIAESSPLVPILQRANVPYEKDLVSDGTLVFEFIVDHGPVRPCKEVSPWEQFCLVAMLQRCYSDNCVSATIYFDKVKDGSDVEKMLAMFIPQLKSVSMLPHSGHQYKQAPYEEISEETYRARLSLYGKLDFSNVTGNVPIGSKYCNNDTCEL